MLSVIDQALVGWLRRWEVPLSRTALFVVYFWFGILKIFQVSPANPLVASLLDKTLPFVTFDQFIVFFACYEMLLGISFLLPGWERVSIAMLIPHMITTFLPLIFLSEITWQSPFVPTLEGQYIIKNLLIIALAFSLAARLTPWGMSKKS